VFFENRKDRLGYREITRTSYKGSPTILFERERTTA
jgi:hypothetical protein